MKKSGPGLSWELTNIGAVFVRLGMITEGELAEAVEAQRACSSDKPLGERLVAAGRITLQQLQDALRFQEGLRSGTPKGMMAALDAQLTQYQSAVRRVDAKVATLRGYKASA